MSDTLRSHIHEAGTTLSRSLGTFIALGWVVFVSSVVAVRAIDVPVSEESVPVELYWIGVFVVAAIAAVWLVDGGYERVGADPAGVWTFVWLAVVLIPLAFSPLRIALENLSLSPSALDIGFVLATTVASVWLAFYHGLERLTLELEDLIRVFVYVLVLGVIPVVSVVVLGVSWLTDPPIAAGTALTVQTLACWLGLTRSWP